MSGWRVVINSKGMSVPCEKPHLSARSEKRAAEKAYKKKQEAWQYHGICPKSDKYCQDCRCDFCDQRWHDICYDLDLCPDTEEDIDVCHCEKCMDRATEDRIDWLEWGAWRQMDDLFDDSD